MTGIILTVPRQRADGFWDIAPSSAIINGGLFGAEIGRKKLIFHRSGEEVLAFDGVCPHAGAPLAEGIVCENRVVCPWHKASFDLRSGGVSEPPAVDPLSRFPVQIEDGRVLVSLQPISFASSEVLDADGRCFVILGTGAAGQSAAQTLREEGFAGRLVMVSRESNLPYDRTLLSKYTLSGQSGSEKTPLQDASFYMRHRIERMTEEIAAIDVSAATVRFKDGRLLPYDTALLATGGNPKRPDLPGAELGGVFLLRVPSDADAILEAAAHAQRVTVVGGGFIGMEAAASLRERGLEVTVVMPEATPFERSVGPMIGAVFARLHEQNGVVLRTRQTVTAFEGKGWVSAVRLENGECLPSDFVVVGGGIRPATDRLHGVALGEDGGVLVDRYLCAGDRLFAAGDLASFPLYGDGDVIRVEHWRVAQQHGRTAASNMLGRERPFDAVPYFWTIHFLKRLDYVGYAAEWDDIVIDGDLEKPEFIALYIKSGVVDAVVGWDRDQDIARTICLFEQRRDWQAGSLLSALAEQRNEGRD